MLVSRECSMRRVAPVLRRFMPRFEMAAPVVLAAIVIAAATVPARAQTGESPPSESPGPPAGDWPLHNRDAQNTRYSPLSEIDARNVGELRRKWSRRLRGAVDISSVTPIVVDGVMYVNVGSTMYALDAATGETAWRLQLEEAFRGAGRGPIYADGRVYAIGPAVMYAVDASTGRLVESFGRNGLVRVINRALGFKYPDRYPENFDPLSIGYRLTTPAYYNRTLYVGLSLSENLIPGGLMVALDAETGAIKWVFNAIPQGPGDEGWEIARDTWSGSGRYGGGIWQPAAIDPELGLIYAGVGNPAPDYDGSSRKGMNLFTDSLVALDLDSGKLAWHFQVLHHDIWDWDVTGPVLFNVGAAGRTISGVATVSKTCDVFMLNRKTGNPINFVVESAVPTVSDVPGEEVWPTQPLPYTARGVPQLPYCWTYPVITDSELAPRVRERFHPYLMNDFVITSPGNGGGGTASFSPQTGLLYVSGKNDAWSIKVNPVGDTQRPSAAAIGHHGVIGERGKTGVVQRSTLAAYDPVSGEQMWYRENSGTTNRGNLVTAGGLVFQGVISGRSTIDHDPSDRGRFFAVDARSGQLLFEASTDAPIRANPLTYEADGNQYVAIVASQTVIAFGLP